MLRRQYGTRCAATANQHFPDDGLSSYGMGNGTAHQRILQLRVLQVETEVREISPLAFLHGDTG